MNISCIHGIDADPDCTNCKGAGYVEREPDSIAIEVQHDTGRITVAFDLWRCACTTVIGVGP